MAALTESVNFLFILLGVAIGIFLGVFGEKARIRLHHARKAMYAAMPLMRVAGFCLAGFVGLIVMGLVWVGVI